MKKILLLITLIAVLVGCIIYIENNTRLNDDFKKAGIVFQPPYNQLKFTRDVLPALISQSSDAHLMGAYYYIDDSKKDDFRFFTLNIYDLSHVFKERTFKDEFYYENYMNSALKLKSFLYDSSTSYRRLVKGAPAVLYYYQRDMGDSLFIPTKVAIICCNKKAYYLEAAAIDNVDGWFDEVEQAISFKDFAKYRRASIAFMVLLAIGAAISLGFVVRESVILIKANKPIWINKKAHNLYRYIKVIIIIDIIVSLICFSNSSAHDVWIIFIVLEILVRNGLLLFYLRKKAIQEYSEDYLVPQWFKNKFYKYLNNKAELRAIILFLFMPLFYVVPLPFGFCAIVFYTIPVCLLIGAYIGFKWIKAGKNESL